MEYISIAKTQANLLLKPLDVVEGKTRRIDIRAFSYLSFDETGAESQVKRAFRELVVQIQDRAND